MTLLLPSLEPPALQLKSVVVMVGVDSATIEMDSVLGPEWTRLSSLKLRPPSVRREFLLVRLLVLGLSVPMIEALNLLSVLWAPKRQSVVLVRFQKHVCQCRPAPRKVALKSVMSQMTLLDPSCSPLVQPPVDQHFSSFPPDARTPSLAHLLAWLWRPRLRTCRLPRFSWKQHRQAK